MSSTRRCKAKAGAGLAGFHIEYDGGSVLEDEIMERQSSATRGRQACRASKSDGDFERNIKLPGAPRVFQSGVALPAAVSTLPRNHFSFAELTHHFKR